MLRRLAHPLLAAVFVAHGVDTLLNLKPKVEAAKPMLAKGQEALPGDRTVDPAAAVQVDAAAKIAAGLLLGFGKAPRLAAAVLAASLIPTTVVEHPFWSARYVDERRAQQWHVAKNAGLLGGLLLAISDTRGKPSLAWRAGRARKQAERTRKHAEQVSSLAAARARRAGTDVTRKIKASR